VSVLLDSSILIAALAPDEASHSHCLTLLKGDGNVIYSHALLETFATLTGGRLGVKVDGGLAARILSETVLPRVRVIELHYHEITSALTTSKERGIRGGAVYDYRHLIAAKKAGVAAIYTLNRNDFLAFQRDDDPEILLL
jgi:predicted nucleic acid-binding protein